MRVMFALLMTGVWSGTAWSAARTLPVSSGDCDDASLRTAARVFADSLKSHLKDQVADGASGSRQLKPRASSSKDELQRQLAQAQTHFYNLQYFKAEQQAEDALKEIELLEPGPDRRALATSAHLLLGVVRLGNGKAAAADEAFAHILRLDPAHLLDPDYYSPSTRERFDQVRRKIAAGKRVNLLVQSTPPGGEVFVDGYSVGRTPFTGKFPTGKYQVMVAQGPNATSFPHPVDLSSDAAVKVDLLFEGSVFPGQPLCIAAPKGHGDPLAGPAQLGAQLGMEEVVLIRLRKKSPGAQWLTATLISAPSGQELREGGMKVQPTDQAGAFDDLVAYIATGRASPAVVVADAGAPPAPWAIVAPSPEVAAPAPPPAVTPPAPSLFWKGTRAHAWVPAVAGGALLLGGTALTVFAHSTEASLRAGSTPRLEVDAAVSKGRTFETAGLVMLAAGVVSAGVSGAMFAFDSPSTSGPQLSVVPLRSGALAGLRLNW